MWHKIVSFLKKPSTILIIILLLGLFLRVYNLWDSIFISYDQARDAQRIQDLLFAKDLKLVGPETDIPGIFNGPLFYYLLAPVYFIFNFDPNYVALFLSIINLSGALLLYKVAMVLFKEKKVALIAAFLWAISFEQLGFSKYISNASLMSISSLIYFLGLAFYFIEKKSMGLIMSIIGLTASIHFNIYLGYLFVFYPIFYFIYRPQIKVKQIALNTVLFFFLLSPFIIAELLWKFNGVKSLLEYMSHQSGSMNDVVESFTLYIQRVSASLYYSQFSFNIFLASLFLIGFIFIVKKSKSDNLVFLFLWLFSTLPLFGFRSGVINVAVINSSIFGAIILVFAKGLSQLLQNKKSYAVGIFILLLFFISNLFLFVKQNVLKIESQSAKNNILLYEKMAMDYTYKKAGGKKFSICTITEPLFMNTTWSFLYDWYGKNKYGYVPYWSGSKQYMNKNNLPDDVDHTQLRFLLFENQGGIPDHAWPSALFAEDQLSTLEDEVKIGNMTIQMRKLEKNKKLLRDTQNLSLSDKRRLKSVTEIDNRYTCYHE